MSALQNHSFSVPSQRRLSEVELLRAISQITWNATDEVRALASIAAVVARVPGLIAFRYEPAPGAQNQPLQASAVAGAAANGHYYGQVRIFFDPKATRLPASPVRLAKFIGQQTGILLHRLSLARERRRHLDRLEAIHRITRRRKLIHRAAGILAQQRSVSRTEAVSLMVNYARQHRHHLLYIAESLIFERSFA